MAAVQPRYSKEEFARRGDAIYEQEIRPQMKPDDEGRFVAIDIESGDFEVDDFELPAIKRLRERRPEAQTWLVRVGSRSVHHFGMGRGGRASP